MSKNKRQNFHNAAKTKATVSTAQANRPAAPKPRKPLMRFFKPLMFLLLAVFCIFTYGDVFARAEQEMYVCADTRLLKYTLDQPLGWLYIMGRWALLVFKSKWIGGLVLATILTATACQIDFLLKLPSKWRAVSFLVPIAELAWMASRGIRLFYRSEPGLIMVVPICIFLVLFCAAMCVRCVRRKRKEPATAESTAPKANAVPILKNYGAMIAIVAYAALTAYAIYFQENTRLASSMQLDLWEQNWEQMEEDALKARKPSRTVAANYAIALLRQNLLVEHIFDIPYNYPNDEAKTGKAHDEYGLFVPDCNFAAGCIQAAYHECMEAHVMYGISLYRLKRMTLCALLNEEYVLARKYLAMISQMPFEQSFVEKYGAMADNPKLIDQDPELADIKDYIPLESKFEQYYQTPIFLGYNVGLAEGSNKTLLTSIVSCMYSKKVDALIPRLQVLQSQGIPLHPILQQAVVCASVKHPEVAGMFNISKLVSSELQGFLRAAVPYKKDKNKMREVLKEDWLGTYMYYYFCENNDSIATGKYQREDGGVN